MTRRSEHFFGDMVRQTTNPEDEYINLAIEHAKPRSKHITELEKRVARFEMEQLIKEFKKHD